MNATAMAKSEDFNIETHRYAKCIEVSKRIRWEIEKDVIKGREFDTANKFLPDGLSKVNDLDFLSEADAIFLSQIQGRTYANIFGLVERFIGAKTMEVCQDHTLKNQVAFEALLRFCDEELKHQELFRQIDVLAAKGMPEGYQFPHDPDEVAKVVLSKSTWSILALTCHIELFTQVHYKESIEPNENLSQLFKDVFLFHWKEESQHAILDELEWRRENAKLNEAEKDQCVTDLIDLVVAVDGILGAQSSLDSEYFLVNMSGDLTDEQKSKVADTLLKAYRWQYIVSGVMAPRFGEILGEMVSESQLATIHGALGPLIESVN